MRDSSARFLFSTFTILFVFNVLLNTESRAQTRSRTSTRPPVRRAQPARSQVDAYAPEPGYSAPSAEPSASSDSSLETREQRRTPDLIWQAHAGRIAVTGELGYALGRPDLKLNGGKIGESERSRFKLNVGGEYGVTRNIAVRARTSYGTSTIENKLTIANAQNSTFKASGLGDVELGGKVLYPVRSFLVSGDLGLGFSFGNRKPAMAGQDGNMYSGGMSLNPTVGGAAYLGRAGFVGGLLAYRFKFERTEIESSGATAKITGGNQIVAQLFYEFQHQNFFVSPSLLYTMTDDAKSNVNGPTTTIVSDSVFAMAIKGGMYITPELRLAATYTLSSVPENNSSATPTSSYYDHDFLVSGRMEF